MGSWSLHHPYWMAVQQKLICTTCSTNYSSPLAGIKQTTPPPCPLLIRLTCPTHQGMAK